MLNQDQIHNSSSDCVSKACQNGGLSQSGKADKFIFANIDISNCNLLILCVSFK